MIVEAAIRAAKAGGYARSKSAKEKTRKLGVRPTFGRQRLCGEFPFAGTINTLEGDHPKLDEAESCLLCTISIMKMSRSAVGLHFACAPLPSALCFLDIVVYQPGQRVQRHAAIAQYHVVELDEVELVS